MEEYDIIIEMLKRHNAGKLNLTDQEANLLAMQAQRLGEQFRVESKPISKGLFDAADMATFGLLPNQWRPTSQGQDVFGESGLDRFAGGVGSIAGLATGIGGAVKGIGMAGKAITARGGIKGAVAAAKEATAVKRANAYASSLYNRGQNVVGAGIGRAAGYGSRAAEFAAQSPGLQTAANVARGLGSSAAALGRAGYGALPAGVRQYTSPALRRGRDWLRNPAGLNVPPAQGLQNLDPWVRMQMGVQKGGYIPPKKAKGYQEGGWEPDMMDPVVVQAFDRKKFQAGDPSVGRPSFEDWKANKARNQGEYVDPEWERHINKYGDPSQRPGGMLAPPKEEGLPRRKGLPRRRGMGATGMWG